MPSFVGQKLVGVDLDLKTTAQEHVLGERVVDESGGEYIYVKASATIAANQVVTMLTGFIVDPVAANEVAVGFNTGTAFAANEYGWIQVSGRGTAEVTTGLSAGAMLSRVAAGTGEFAAAIDVDEGGATAHGIGDHDVIGYLLADESGGVADVYLF